MANRLMVVIPCYNEEEVLPETSRRLTEKMHALGPRQALKRGYALVMNGHTPITCVSQATEKMTLLLQDGRMDVRLENVRKEDPFGEETANL